MRPPDSWRTARLTVAIVGVTSLCWVLPWALGYQSIVAICGGFIPARLHGATSQLPLATPPGSLHAVAFNCEHETFCPVSSIHKL